MGTRIAIFHVPPAGIVVWVSDFAERQTAGNAPSDYRVVKLVQLTTMIGPLPFERILAIALGGIGILPFNSLEAQNIDLSSAVSAAEGIAEQALLARAGGIEDPYRIQFDVGSYHTNNALFSNQNELSDSYTQYLLSLGATVPFERENLFFNVGVVQLAYQYDQFGPGLDYEFLKVTPGFLYKLDEVDAPVFSFFEEGLLFLLYDYNRFSNDTLLQELFTGHSLSFGVIKSMSLTEMQSLVFGLDLEPSLKGNLENNRRHRARILLAHDVQWTDALSSRLAYNAFYADFTDVPRGDLSHSFLANLNWSIHERAFGGVHCEFYATGTLNYYINDSNQTNRTYKFFTAGASVGVRASF